MNEQQRAVVQQALEALKGLYAITEIAQEDIDCRFAWAEMPDAKEAITALRQLLEQPEPVAHGVNPLWLASHPDQLSTPPIVATPLAQPTGDKLTPDEGGAA